MTSAYLIETLDGIAKLLREAIEEDRELDVQIEAVMLAAIESCSQEIEQRWENE